MKPIVTLCTYYTQDFFFHRFIIIHIPCVLFRNNLFRCTCVILLVWTFHIQHVARDRTSRIHHHTSNAEIEYQCNH